MSDLSNALDNLESFICNSLEEVDNWRIVDSEYDDEDCDGMYWGYVKVRFFNKSRDEISDNLDWALGNWFNCGDGEWEWAGKSTVEIRSIIWDESEDGEPDED